MNQAQKIGMSAAASWAWGTSLIVGMQIAQDMGLVVWLIWATANTLTLSFFGELMRRGILGRHVFDLPAIKWLALLIQVFCLIIQLNIINDVLLDLNVSATLSYWLSSGIGILFVVAMYRHGLITSILTDVWQWLICMGAIVVILILGWTGDVTTITYPSSTTSGILWGVWSACILMSGLIGDVQHWQRAERAEKLNAPTAYHWGALFFGIYMALVLAMSRYEFTFTMNVVLLLAVLCVTTSTIDSIAVAMHEIANKTIGTVIAVLICVSWGVFCDLGIIELWSKIGVYRVGFALLILVLGVQAFNRERAKRVSVNSKRTK